MSYHGSMTNNEKGRGVTPEYGTEDYRRWSVLFNDVTRAPLRDHVLFSDRLALTQHLWAQGWRRDVRPEDVTRGEDVALGSDAEV